MWTLSLALGLFVLELVTTRVRKEPFLCADQRWTCGQRQLEV